MGVMDWIDMVQDRKTSRGDVKAVMNLRVPQFVVNLLSS